MRRAFAVSIYCRHELTILLVNHRKQQAWVPIGGEVEPGETPREAAIREIQEEVGWVLGRDYEFANQTDVPGTPTGLIAYEEHEAGPKGIHMCFNFVVEAKGTVIAKCDEFPEHAWVASPFDVSPVPENVARLSLRALALPRPHNVDVNEESYCDCGAPLDATLWCMWCFPNRRPDRT